MALDDEIAEMQTVAKRLRAQEIMLQAMDAAFDEIFGPKPAEDESPADEIVDKDGGLAAEAAATARATGKGS